MIVSGRITEFDKEPTEVETKSGIRYRWNMVVEYDYNSDWPKHAQCEFFGKEAPRAFTAGDIVEGAEVTVEGNIESRYSANHQRWFTSFKAWKINVVLGPPVVPPQAGEYDDVQLPAQPTQDEIPF